MLTTSNLGLRKPEASDVVDINDFNENADKLDGAIGNMSTVPTTAKNAAGAIAELHNEIENIDPVPADGSITDGKIGTRTIDDTVIAAPGADTPTRLWSKLANMIKGITGAANWYTLPSMTISAIITALNLRAPINAPVFTGNVTLPSTTSIGNISSAEIGQLDGVTSSIQNQLNAKEAKRQFITLSDAVLYSTLATEQTPASGQALRIDIIVPIAGRYRAKVELRAKTAGTEAYAYLDFSAPADVDGTDGSTSIFTSATTFVTLTKDMEVMWPELSKINCWTGVNQAGYLRNLRVCGVKTSVNDATFQV